MKLTLYSLLLLTMSVPQVFAQNHADTLAEQLQATAKNSVKRMPAEMIRTMQDAVETVRQSEIESKAKQVGDQAIDAELKNWKDESVRLSDLWKNGPIVLMWYRGGWCPYCNIQLRAMQQKLQAIEGAGAQLVVLTPEIPEKAKETASKNDLAFVSLFDSNNDVARKYGLVFKLPDPIVPIYRDRLKLNEFNDNDAMELPLSATYVIDTDGVIRYAFLDADYKKRAEPSVVVDEILKLTTPKR
ncbi:peroxiredoxin-like family protein [Roseiconus lacunae]|uniref:peroxiredoxin-like family protein n=1 Tax=Roseiconus lacunae TaxID=2605694 RepID=UPI0011F351A6